MDILIKTYKFPKDESGAVTVDWVALTAVIVLVAGSTIAAVNNEIEGLAGEIATHVSDQSLG